MSKKLPVDRDRTVKNAVRERYSEAALIRAMKPTQAPACCGSGSGTSDPVYSVLIFCAGYTACSIGSALKIAQHGVEKSRKPRVEVRLAKGGYEAYALLALRNDAGLPQDAVMMRLR